MHKKYIELFKQILRAVITMSDQVAAYNKNKNDEKGESTANSMSADYKQLLQKIEQENFVLTKAEYAKLLVGVLIIINNIENRIVNEKKAIENYKIEIVPKLEKIIAEENDDKKADELSKELFIIDENK